jgi:hypothetical protein
MKTVLHPTAGYIANCANQSNQAYVADLQNISVARDLSQTERDYLRELAKQVKAISDLPVWQQKKDLWYKHCSLKNVRTMLLVFPEDSWVEIIPPETMTIENPFWAQQEWYLRHLIYRYEHIRDDFVIEPVMYVPLIVQRGDWGVRVEYTRTSQHGSYVWKPPIQTERDLEKLKNPAISVDTETQNRNMAALQEVLGDILEIRSFCFLPGVLTYDIAADLRGIEELMMDMYDRPQWLARLMDMISDGICNEVRYLEENGYLTGNCAGHYVDTGGLAYTNDLPGNQSNGHVRLCDLWGYGAAQAATGIGPEMHEEFILKYDKKILDQCGMVSYGCCEPYTTKFGMLKKHLPNLRRVSVSPWCDPVRAAEELTNRYLYSLKPNPALIAEFDPELVRQDVRNKLEVSKGCQVEIILKDTNTIHNDPPRVTAWTEIVRKEIERFSGVAMF